MKHVPRFINKAFRFFPNNSFINKIRCFYYNFFKKPDFKISFESNYFKVIFENSLVLKFYDNPFYDLLYPLNGYLKNYDIKKGDNIIDAGTYIGTFTIYSAKLTGENGKVIAFEPDKSNYNKLLKNIELNKVNNIITINKGLWNKNEVIEFDYREDEGSMIAECINGKIKGKIVNCEFVRLDDELKKIGINKVDFIKMDIEGAEIEAIEGCREMLKNNNINLAIASYHIRNNEETCKELENTFNRIGYRSKTEFSQHLTTYACK